MEEKIIQENHKSQKNILPVVEYPDPVLRQKSKKIKNPLDPEIQKLITEMIKSMEAHNGMGLAAPQVGKSIRLCIIKESEQLYVLINPKIKSQSREKVLGEEGCLSFPGKFLNIKRSEKVKVRCLNKKGKPVKIKATGLLARALQHEIDHLDGVLFIDRVGKNLSKKKL